MSRSNRRRFIQRALVSGAALSAKTRSTEATFARTLSPALLHALAEAVLPSQTLGKAGTRQVVEGFTTWLGRYQPVTELNHGYFTGDIRYSPEHPGPRWTAQLEALDLESRKRFAESFVDLDEERRRDLVATQIQDDRLERLPRAASARHVAVGLLAYFYALPETTDLAYRARISKHHCRPLGRAPDPPEPLEESPGAGRG